MALLLLGGAGASLYIMLAAENPPQEEQESSAADDFMKNWAGDSPANPVEAEELEDLVADELNTLGGTDEVTEAMLSRPGEFQYQGSAPFTDPTFEYVVDLPATFIVEESAEGTAHFSGYIAGHKTEILTAAWMQEQGLSDVQVKRDLEAFAARSGLRIVSVEWEKLGGQPILSGRIRTLDDESEGDYILIRRPPLVYFAAIGSAPKNYRSDKGYRKTFLQAHFHPMAD